MKKWRILYWSNLHRTEWIVTANSKENAREQFKKIKGDEIEIIQICETSEKEKN